MEEELVREQRALGAKALDIAKAHAFARSRYKYHWFVQQWLNKKLMILFQLNQATSVRRQRIIFEIALKQVSTAVYGHGCTVNF